MRKERSVISRGSKLSGESVRANNKTNTAHIGALLVQNKNYATLRLLQDYKEINKQNLPLLGVSALPVDDSMFVWHANIKAMSDNHFKGGVLHLEFRFSDFYPLQPPKIRVLNDNISHPNILKCGSICLDMLDIGNGEPYKGWTPAYSVFSILLQLQNFFFDHDFIFETDELRKEAIETVRVMNEYKCKCKSCGHKGASNPKPDFPNIDSKDKFVLSKEQLELLKKNEHSCIIKKTNFEEAPLGYGVSIIRIPRTGEIKGISITQEYLSLKAFQKQRIRNIFTKKGGFTHWLPLYFGNKESLGQFKHLSERAISMITTGTTRNFSPEQINKVYCKIISFMILEFTQDNSTLCSKAIKTLIHIFKAYRLMLDFYPDQQKFIEDSVNKFIKDPAHRIKDNTSSLGDLLSFSLMTENNCHKDLIPPYVDESMDRSIFWIIKLLPELEELINSSKIDDVRSKVCFSAASKSNYLLSIFYYFNAKVLQKESKTCTEINLELDKCYGNLDEDIIYQHVKKIKEILKIDNFGKLYESIGLKNLNESEMNNKIKQAFQNSLSKNYHGGEDEVRFVPDERTQINVLLNKFASVGDLVNKNELLPAEDPIWKKLCSSLDISKKLIYDQPSVQLTPDLIAAEYEKATLNEYYYSKPDNFRNVSSTDEYFIKQTTSDLGVETEKEFLSKLTFREVYLKIFLEFYIKNFRYILDFKELYSLLDTFAPIISHLTIIVNKDENIKSDYNYIRAVISKLTKVKILKFIINTNISLKLIKNIIKGYSIFIKEGGETEYLKIFNDKIYSSHTCQEYNILSILDKMSKLKCLDCSNTKLNNYVILRIRNQLYYHKTLQSLVLSNCDINDDMAKELADGIMKAKNLKHIDLSSNITNKGLSSVVYNLAFQPLLNSLNLSNSGKVDAKELSSALYKLIKMSMSLENLDASNVIGLNSNLSVDFFASLGDNSYLKKLNLSGSGSITENNLLLLGNSLAFNSLKKGSLVEVYLSNCGITYPGLVKFVDGMFVSEHLHNQWYNSPFNSEITKESKEYYVKYFNCAITYLNLSQNNFTTNIMINDPKNLSPNHLQYLTNQNLNLTELILDNITNNKNFVDLIVNALHSANSLKTLSLRSSNLNGDLCRLLAGAFGTKEKPNQFCKISYLDLALNHFGYSGIEAFSNILQFNKTLEVISFYHGLFDVNGARRLAEALEVNTSLKILDIGYNRIKDLGLNTIISSIEKNKNSKLTVLSTKYNFLKTKSFINMYNKILAGDINLNKIHCGNNCLDEKLLNEFFTNNYLKKRESGTPVPNIHCDAFELLQYITPDRLERTVWISPLNYNEKRHNILSAIYSAEAQSLKENDQRIGIPNYVAIKRGRKTGAKKDVNKAIGFIEFLHPNSANIMLKIASINNGFMMNGKKLRVFKAGTRTEFIVVKKSKYSFVPKNSSEQTGRGGFKGRGGRGGFRGKADRGGRGTRARDIRGGRGQQRVESKYKETPAARR